MLRKSDIDDYRIFNILYTRHIILLQYCYSWLFDMIYIKSTCAVVTRNQIFRESNTG